MQELFARSLARQSFRQGSQSTAKGDTCTRSTRVTKLHYIVLHYIFNIRARARAYTRTHVYAQRYVRANHLDAIQVIICITVARIDYINRVIRFLLLQLALRDALDPLHSQYSIDIRN